MAEYQDSPDQSAQRQSYRFDPFTLLAGIAAVLVSAYVVTDGAIPLPEISDRWVLAGGAALVGVLLLLGSLRRKR